MDVQVYLTAVYNNSEVYKASYKASRLGSDDTVWIFRYILRQYLMILKGDSLGSDNTMWMFWSFLQQYLMIATHILLTAI